MVGAEFYQQYHEITPTLKSQRCDVLDRVLKLLALLANPQVHRSMAHDPALTLPLGSSTSSYPVLQHRTLVFSLARMRVLEFLVVNMECFGICLERNDAVRPFKRDVACGVPVGPLGSVDC